MSTAEPAPAAPAAAESVVPGWAAASAQARLHVVTGKGGTGKTTVAAALALTLAAGNRRVLLIEVEERQGIARLFDLPPLPYAETRIAVAPDGGEVRALAVDVEAALLEYFQLFYNLGLAGRALKRMGAVEFATTLAPGLRDVLLTGKAKETVTRRAAGGEPIYDAVVMDGPPTGRIVTFLNVTVAMADLAQRGPIRSQAEGVATLLHSPSTAVHLVTHLEDMPVTETLEAIAELREVGLPVGSIIVNAVTDPLLPADALDAAAGGDLDAAAVADGLAAAGLTVDQAGLKTLVEQATDHAARVTREYELESELATTGLPMLNLPRLVDGVDLGGLYELSEMLTDQGVTLDRERP
ncbi:ArsA-related P-loop ATPase [Nakamurella lactea]|uniref:ArsA-related P-loop ATPase n=1 Tax=Nakamurella lactea TaxID=459515 RepID=UPI0004171D6A|nr:ArsA-related P-loop ATPase [Nakamurella lactea]